MLQVWKLDFDHTHLGPVLPTRWGSRLWGPEEGKWGYCGRVWDPETEPGEVGGPVSTPDE